MTMTGLTPDIRGRVLIFDKDSNWANAAKQILSKRNILADVESGDFHSCHAMAEKTTYVVMIVNVHALDQPMKQMVQFSESFPTCAILTVAEHDDPDAIRFLWPPSNVAHYHFGKKDLFPITELAHLTEDIIRLRGMLSTNVKVVISDGVQDALDRYAQSWSGTTKSRQNFSMKVMVEELEVIVGLLFSYSGAKQPIAREVYVAPFEESGRSASSMFNVTPKIILDETKRKSAVLKFGPKIETRTEAHNYDRFVEWFLTVEQTVRKIGYAEANNFGGILYSYPRDVAGGYESFADYMRKNSPEHSTAIVKKMFNVNNKHWLSVDGNKYVDRDMTVFQTYYIEHVLHASIHEMKNGHFRKLADEIRNLEKKNKCDIWTVTDDKITFPLLDMSIPNPISLLTRPLIDEIKLTVIHGDLHGHNILIDEKGRYFFIDFFYTGYGDIYRDFIELELSVRYDLFCSRELPMERRLTASDSGSINIAGLRKLLRLEKALASGRTLEELKDPLLADDQVDIGKAFKIISEIRRFAFENQPGNNKLYFLGLAFSSLKALKYFYPVDVKIHRLIVAGLHMEALQKSGLL